MSAAAPVLSLLVFEAAGCLMAVPASEISQLNARQAGCGPSIDLGQYFDDAESDGPWLRWVRANREAWLRVRRVVDVTPVSLSGLSRMPALLRDDGRTQAFLAAGVRGDDVFLLLDPERVAR